VSEWAPEISVLKDVAANELVPQCPIDSEEYERFYVRIGGNDNQLPEQVQWQELRLRPGMAERDVYRLLPAANDFEYSGYITPSRIRYFQAGPVSAGMLLSKACTFHSHPTKNPHLADIPSLKDIHSFLFYRHLRTVTVGATKLWVWDKTKATMGTVRRLADWMVAKHFEMVAQCMRQNFEAWNQLYVQTAMRDLGWVWPETFDDMDAEWPTILRRVLKIKVRVFPRELGVTPR
jgi:hypothetical protein